MAAPPSGPGGTANIPPRFHSQPSPPSCQRVRTQVEPSRGGHGGAHGGAHDGACPQQHPASARNPSTASVVRRIGYLHRQTTPTACPRAPPGLNGERGDSLALIGDVA